MLKIKVFENSNLIDEYEMNQVEFTIGRSDECDISLDSHPGISRKHARITLHQDEYLIERVSQGGKLIKDGESITSLTLQDLTTSVSIPPYTFQLELPRKEAPVQDHSDNAVIEAKNIVIHEEESIESKEQETYKIMMLMMISETKKKLLLELTKM